jgi:hypothetical protein
MDVSLSSPVMSFFRLPKSTDRFACLFVWPCGLWHAVKYSPSKIQNATDAQHFFRYIAGCRWTIRIKHAL